MKKIRQLISAAAFVLVLSNFGGVSSADDKTDTLIYFFSPSCHRCIATRENVMPYIEERFKGKVSVDYKDISDPENYKLLFSMKRNAKADEQNVFPVLYFGGKFTDGRDESNLTHSSLTAFIESSLGKEAKHVSTASDSDILKYFKEIQPVAIMVAGFVDGINPCAFTVIVFFISFLFFHNYTKKHIALVGLAFIMAVFTTYVLIGLGLFGWLHAMKGFWFVTAVVNIVIALLAISLGALSLYDAIIFARRGKAEDMLLQLPKSIKNRIHSIIGKEYRKKENTGKSLSPVALFFSALGVGFLVSIFESVCTGQLYLPTIMFVFKTTEHKLMAFFYLVMYNVMFTVPLFAIYLLAMAGVTSERFSMALKKNMVFIKVFMALLFFFLGVSLLYADTTDAVNVKAPEQAKLQGEAQSDPNFYDFGKVKEGDIIKHTFILKNKEDKPVNIVGVNTSCACTSSKVDVKTLAAGQEVPVELEFDTKGYPGVRKRQLFVHTDSVANPLIIFEVQADVGPK
ncbi:MAG: DUF1573 domain-containing protein [Candidatus Omnitrophica bacterium]|nr:DUF1573 domain-containing protein [Candidatus Omnitrophota bacterium]